MRYAPDVLILAALVLLAVAVGLLTAPAFGFLTAAAGCGGLGVWIGLRGGDDR